MPSIGVADLSNSQTASDALHPPDSKHIPDPYNPYNPYIFILYLVLFVYEWLMGNSKIIFLSLILNQYPFDDLDGGEKK